MSWVIWDNTDRDGTLQIIPEGDLMGHESSVSCACGPEAELVNGYWLITHASLDGRELDEYDYEAAE
jgi:hypothetical protein